MSPVHFHKYDVSVAKNYLTGEELEKLGRIVSSYLDYAEFQALRHIPMTMKDWEDRLNRFLTMWDHGVLQDNGKISSEIAKLHAETEFEKFRTVQDWVFQSDFDRFLEAQAAISCGNGNTSEQNSEE